VWREALPPGLESCTGLRADRDVQVECVAHGSPAVLRGSVDTRAAVASRVVPVDDSVSRDVLARWSW